MHDQTIARLYQRAASGQRIAIIPNTYVLPPVDVLAVSDDFPGEGQHNMARLCDALMDAYHRGGMSSDVARQLREIADDME